MSTNPNKTSCSDNGKYPELCRQASTNEQAFSTFRRHPDYTAIVETVPRSAGQEYLKIALSQTPQLEGYLEEIASIESVGDPISFTYSKSLLSKKYVFSPTTLRYIKILSDLILTFGSLDGLNIIEIGGGYGGLCKIISDVFKFEHYTLVDLSPCLDLCEKVLSTFCLSNISYLTQDSLPSNANYDLVISNYAFTEVRRKIQNVYIERVLQRSKGGYLLCNWNTHTWRETQIDEALLKKMIPEVKIFKDDSILAPIDMSCKVELAVWNKLKG